MPTKKIVIIGANEFQNRLILKAKSLGYETHVFAWASGDIGETTADYFYPISITEKEEILKKCNEINPDAICSIASDLATLTVNYVAEKLGLPGNPISISEQCTNKYVMREVMQRNNIKTPYFIKVTSNDNIEKINLENLHFPVIVKPTDRSGSRGITKVTNPKNLPEAIKVAQNESFEKSAIVEEFIDGEEYSCECITQDGKHHLLAFTKKYTTGAPNFIETGHYEPSDISQELLGPITENIFKALSALGIQNSASHTEFKIDNKGNFGIIEIGARMGGDCIGSDLVELSTGYDFLKMVLDVSLGNPLDIPKSQPFSHYALIKFIFSENDLLKIEKANKFYPNSLQYLSQDDDFDHKITDSSNRFGFAIYSTDNKETATKLQEVLFNE